jgi:V8-like Glu-specific endopeptidase
MAGLGKVAIQVDLEGAPLIVASDILHALDVYGFDDTGVPAIDRFLNTILPLLGDNSPSVSAITTFLNNSGRVRPALVTHLDPSDDPTTKDISFVEERIIGENTLRDISFFEAALNCARSVAYIETPKWTGTGFLVCDDILVTNWHVLPSRDVATASRFVFNYQRLQSGAIARTDEYRFSSTIYIADETMDLAIVSLAGDPGGTWGTLRVARSTAQKDEKINIIQHPAGLPKHITTQNNYVLSSDGKFLQYVTSTLGGSSGAPVFSDEWLVVGIHQSGGYLKTAMQGRAKLRNRAIAVNQLWKMPLGTVADSIRSA